MKEEEVLADPEIEGDHVLDQRNEDAHPIRRELKDALAQGPVIGDDRDQNQGTLVIVMVRSHRIDTRIESYLLF